MTVQHSRHLPVGLLAAIALVLVFTSAPGRADVLFSTFGPGNSFSTTSGGAGVTGSNVFGSAFSEADRFNASFSGQLSAVTVAVNFGVGGAAANGTFDLAIAPNNPVNDLPLVSGAVTVGTLQTASTTPVVLTLANPAAYPFAAGSAYWLILAPHDSNTNVVWAAATNPVATTTAYMSVTTQGQFAASGNGANAFQISASVPEPSSQTALFAAASSLAALGWWHRRNHSLRPGTAARL